MDFLYRERRLIVELDGHQHVENARDERRTGWLNRQGYDVIRFWNHEVNAERRAVLDTIIAALEGRLQQRCDVTRFFPANAAQSRPLTRRIRATLSPMG